MCGIAGYVTVPGGAERGTLERQLGLLMHRGPDASGGTVDDLAAVGQTRLAVIDLDTGDPPIRNEDETISVALNGEIYNYRSLRAQLISEGHRLTTRGDTEVVAHLAEACTPTVLARRLDGMFAFAVWDARRGRLVLGRDRLGKKPLYYWYDGATLVFASEIKAVLAHPDVSRDLDPSAIPAYLTFGYVPTPRTFFRGIHSIPPAHVLCFDGHGPPSLERYWEPPLPGPDREGTRSMDDSAGQVRALLRDAIERRLISDVPFGAFLSGGIDSSAVVGLMAEQLDEPVHTFTIGFDDQEGFDERPYARLVANRFRTEHHELVVQPDTVELVERLVWHHDQPFGDSSAIPTYLLNEFTRQHVTVALSGDGGDELFAGYERFLAALAIGRYLATPKWVRTSASRGLAALPARLAHGRVGRVQRAAVVAEQGLPSAYLAWVSIIDAQTRRGLLRARDDSAHEDYRRLWRSSEGAHTLDRLLDLNLRTYLLDDLLVKADRMSMAHALEVRSPFLDTSLVEYVARLPPSWKIHRFTMKRILKQALGDLLPSEILARRKRGFGIPLDRWFREDLRGYLQGTVGSPDARLRQHLVPASIDALLSAHSSRKRNLGGALWTLLTLEIFLRREGW